MWHEYEDGKTINQNGSESGRIIVDEEHLDGARITIEALESTGKKVYYSITCGIYGLFVHTAYADTEDAANSKCDAMKEDIEDMVNVTKEDNIYTLVDKFVEKY